MTPGYLTELDMDTPHLALVAATIETAPTQFRKTPYTDMIRERLAMLGAIGTDPWHVEAYMRLEFPTLDHLTQRQFDEEVVKALDAARCGGDFLADQLANTYFVVVGQEG